MLSSLRIPIVSAPMAGGPTTPELAAAVSGAGGFGFLAAGYLTPEKLAAQITLTRELTPEPFGVNVFVPGQESTVDVQAYRGLVATEAGRYGTEPGEPRWSDDHYPAKIDLLVAERIPVVSFTFGPPRPEDVRRLHEVGTEVAVTVTSPDEARWAADLGADSLCVQGFEAGGHRGLFIDDPDSPVGGEAYGLLAGLRLVGAAVDLPLVAAGGIVDGRDVAAVLAGGAVAAQCGTAFLRSPEAGTSEVQRTALTESRRTTVTRAFSGRPARGLVNRFISEYGDVAPAAYPQVNGVTRPIRTAAAKAADPEAMSLWAGQTYQLAGGDEPAADVVARLYADARAAARSAAERLGG